MGEQKGEAAMTGLATGVCLHHVSQDSTDIKGLAKFYQELFGFEAVKSPKFDYNVIWLRLPTISLHLIESDPEVVKLQISELWNGAKSDVSAPQHPLRGSHICLSVSNLDSFHQILKSKGIETHERTLPNGKINHVYFSDSDGNGIEVTNLDV